MPAWLNQTDEGKWETAKSAVLKSCQETDPAFLPLVTAVFRKMGGVVADDAVMASWSDAAREAAAEARRNGSHAWKKDEEAFNATVNLASTGGSAESHQRAADLHKVALAAHQSAASEKGPETDSHSFRADIHKEYIQKHEKEAAGFKSGGHVVFQGDAASLPHPSPSNEKDKYGFTVFNQGKVYTPKHLEGQVDKHYRSKGYTKNRDRSRGGSWGPATYTRNGARVSVHSIQGDSTKASDVSFDDAVMASWSEEARQAALEKRRELKSQHNGKAGIDFIAPHGSPGHFMAVVKDKSRLSEAAEHLEDAGHTVTKVHSGDENTHPAVHFTPKGEAAAEARSRTTSAYRKMASHAFEASDEADRATASAHGRFSSRSNHELAANMHRQAALHHSQNYDEMSEGSGMRKGAGDMIDYHENQAKKHDRLAKGSSTKASDPTGDEFMSDTIKASWSDAAREAAAASRKAHMESAEASGSTDFSLHRAATDAHREADDAHRNAANQARKEGKNWKYHNRQARQHEALANHHSDLAEEYDSNGAESSDAGGTSFHDDSPAKATEQLASERNMITARDPIVRCRDYGFALSKSVKAKKVWKPGEQVDFQWMPGGVHAITASYGRGDRNVPIELWVHCNEAGARRVQQSFEQIMATNSRRPPFICIEHQAKERAGQPVGFKWGVIEHDQGSDTGIICTCDPSALGANNVNGKIHTSFSPTFDTDADYSQLRCTGCAKDRNGCQCASPHAFAFARGARGSQENPAEVTRLDAQSVGSLTNWNAFKEILPIAAREPETVKAAGTSEGAKKGWEQRAHGATKAAHDATWEVMTSGGDEKRAAELHQTAADIYEANGDKKNAEYHRGHAKWHLGESKIYPTKATDASASDAITASGTSEGAKKGWEHRAGLASLATEAAKRSEKSATDAPSFESHNAASDAHWYASKKHRDAAVEAHREGKNVEELDHQTKSDEHIRKSDFHAVESFSVGAKHRASESYKRIKEAVSNKATDATASNTLHAHCGAQIFLNIPDATAAEKPNPVFATYPDLAVASVKADEAEAAVLAKQTDDTSLAIMQAHAEVINQAELAMVKAQETNNRDDIQALRELIKASNGKILEHGEQVTDTIFTRALKSDAAVRAIALRVEPVDDKFEDTETVFARLAERVAETNRLLEGKTALPKTDDDMVREIMARAHNPAENVTATGTSDTVMATWSDAAREAASLARHYGATHTFEHLDSGDGEKKHHVFEFSTRHHMERFLGEVGGVSHPLGGNRVALNQLSKGEARRIKKESKD